MVNFQKINRYALRSQNKRALIKKKRIQEKKSGILKKVTYDLCWEEYQDIQIPTKGIHTGIISGIVSTYQGKKFSILDQGKNEIIEALLDIQIPHQLGDQIIIGDQVVYINKNGKNYLLKRDQRTNKISRLKGDGARFSLGNRIEQNIVANIDLGIIVASATNPNFHSNFIDRYNIILQYGKVKPLICITKSDLKKLNNPILNWYQNELKIKVVYCSTITGEGIIELKNEINGKMVVLVGNSGVGKSTLINYLIGENNIKTQDVSLKSGQGKHTTSDSHLYEWADNSYIIDTPGIRSLELLEIGKDELKDYFPEFKKYNCKYQNCSHTHEPECGIKKAVSDGFLSISRYDNYLIILKNLI